MTVKEEALKLKNFEEYEKKIDDLNARGLVFDREIAEHFSKILPKAYNPYDEKNDIVYDLPGLGQKKSDNTQK